MQALPAISFAAALLSPALASSACPPPAAALVVSNLPSSNTNLVPSQDNQSATFSLIDASRPGTVNVTEFTTAIAAAHVITVSAASILIDTPVNISGLGGGHRLNLRTDSGSGYGLGPITFNSRINLASNDQLYLSGSAIDECGTSASVEGGHLAINAYLFGVGVQSEPAEFIVSHLSGFSLVTRGSAPARIISSGELPLEEFDHGMPDSQNAIFTNGLLQIELLQTPAAHSFRDPTHSLRKKGAHI